jgi:hypothetical protein
VCGRLVAALLPLLNPKKKKAKKKKFLLQTSNPHFLSISTYPMALNQTSVTTKPTINNSAIYYPPQITAETVGFPIITDLVEVYDRGNIPLDSEFSVESIDTEGEMLPFFLRIMAETERIFGPKGADAFINRIKNGIVILKERPQIAALSLYLEFHGTIFGTDYTDSWTKSISSKPKSAEDAFKWYFMLIRGQLMLFDEKRVLRDWSIWEKQNPGNLNTDLYKSAFRPHEVELPVKMMDQLGSFWREETKYRKYPQRHFPKKVPASGNIPISKRGSTSQGNVEKFQKTEQVQ